MMKSDRMIGLVFWLGPVVALTGMAVYAWAVWPGKFAAAGAAAWFLFFLPAFLGISGRSMEDDIQESAEIETLHIGIITALQRDDGQSWIADMADIALMNSVEAHPGYEENSGVRRWKPGCNEEDFRQYLADGMKLAEEK